MAKPEKDDESFSSTLFFMVILSTACALILSTLASVLQAPKEVAKELDRSREMMIAARMLNHEGYFLVEEKGKYLHAQMNEKGVLIPDVDAKRATDRQISALYDRRFKPYVTNDQGEIKPYSGEKMPLNQYLSEYRKEGYYNRPWKLLYKIVSNDGDSENPMGYVIPVNGFGLWDAIYGYIAIKPDGNTVIGISWYDQKETPGLGANISEAPWQSLFFGKKIFQKDNLGETDFKKAPIGIRVVKGKVSEVLGESPKADSAVDGMAGATLTGNGVTDSYQVTLPPYRPLLIKLQEKYKRGRDE